MSGIELLTSLLKVVAVLALLILALRMVSRQQRGRSRAGGRTTPSALIEVLDQSRIGRSSNVVAVRVGERVLLLGVTESSIENLADVTEDIDLTEDESVSEDLSVLDHAVDLLRSGGFRR